MRMENPLKGHLNRERTVLTFRQRSLEFYATYAAMLLGVAMTLGGFGDLLFGFPQTGMPHWNLTFGPLFFLAGLWAYLLFRFIRFDLRKRTYYMRERSGMFAQVSTGSIDEVNCLGLEKYIGIVPALTRSHLGTWSAPGSVPSGVGFGYVYVLRLWWKDSSRYPPVIEHYHSSAIYGSLDAMQGDFVANAKLYAQLMQVPLFGQIN